jgi:hypothetical protein
MRTWFGTIRNTRGKRCLKDSDQLNKVIFDFLGVEPEMTLEYGLTSPRNFTSAGWKGALSYVAGEERSRIFVGNKEFSWDFHEYLVAFNISAPDWMWRDIVIAYHAFDYFTNSDGG